MTSRLPLSAVAFCLILAGVLTSLIAGFAVADTTPPDISDVHIDPKYPQHMEAIGLYATVVDTESDIDYVRVYYCYSETCEMAVMTDDDMDDVYNYTWGGWAAGMIIDYHIEPMDVSANGDVTEEYWFSIVSNVSVEFQLDPETVITGKQVWANGTAIYDSNESTPVETSEVVLVVEGTTIEVTDRTDSNGDFNITFQAPGNANSDDVNVTVTNRSISGSNESVLTVNLPGDTDGDGLTDDLEEQFGTDPVDPDTDGDGLDDYEEVYPGNDGYETNATSDDTDNDGLDDYEEVNEGEDGFETDPTNQDTDGDSVNDAEDYDPTDPNVQAPPPPEEDDMTIWLVIAVVVIVVIMSVSVLYMVRRRTPPEIAEQDEIE
ncbi:MAG: Hsp20/alpha crystallin family protein [Methanobacteriota archaeon]|nr:MAG: Hsp20/alpha crystallin family protein [Euryarchaeota archaeon]